jgi:hypothetical protein
MRRGPGDRDMNRATLRLACAGLLALLTACVSVEAARPGKAIEPRPGKTLVFGRIRVFADGREYRPWDPASLITPVPYLALLRLGPRRIAPGMPLRNDGSFYWWLPAGDYALIGNGHDVLSGRSSDLERQDMQVLALLRVPADVVASYAGALVLEFASIDVHRDQRVEYDFGRERVDDERVAAEAELQRLFGAPAGQLAVRLMCAGAGLPAFTDPRLFERGHALLDADCRPGETPQPTHSHD